MYSVNLAQLFLNRDDHLFRLKRAERIKNVWNLLFFLLVLTLLTYIWMTWLGLGSDSISPNMTALNRVEYEFQKAWFLIGRVGYALLFYLFTLFITPFIFWLFNDVAYKKIIVLQMNVLLILLLERITWIPLMVYAGLDWYVSPFSFGVIASYFTGLEYVIYFCGTISLFQLFVIWYQIKWLQTMSHTRKVWIWIGVLIWHLLMWAGAAALSYYDLLLHNLIIR
ncbi:hypothetical protein [Halobacillus salinus]|uniref:Yip1 domain-containing protein n=1 Tax=Halobacillus salinus TaxID=192814 RepID=A0A4Z0GX59_9BACI|nr:hypothetical protein [Halobacillus salinus]TGB01852.1 hypothetical protein E4663_14545 [Halobacillus salinus]